MDSAPVGLFKHNLSAGLVVGFWGVFQHRVLLLWAPKQSKTLKWCNKGVRRSGSSKHDRMSEGACVKVLNSAQ